jgi:hypothetical protein
MTIVSGVYVSEGMTQAFIVKTAAIKVGQCVDLDTDGTVILGSGGKPILGVVEGSSFKGKYTGIPGTANTPGQVEVGDKATVRMHGVVRCLVYTGSSVTAGKLVVADGGNPGGIEDAAGTEWTNLILGQALESATGSASGTECKVLLLK